MKLKFFVNTGKQNLRFWTKVKDMSGELTELEKQTHVEEQKPQLKPPSMYKVVLLNDDYTPMDFVVHVLERYFSLPRERAIQLMMQVHNQGRAICGVFTKDVAETKVMQVNDYAKRNEHPLLCSMEAA